MNFDPQNPTGIDHLIIACKHDGSVFHAFIDIDYIKHQFSVFDLVPPMAGWVAQIIPFNRVTERLTHNNPLPDAICQAVVDGLLLHFN